MSTEENPDSDSSEQIDCKQAPDSSERPVEGEVLPPWVAKSVNIARDCRTLHRWSVMAKPVGSEPVLIFKDLVEGIPAQIVSSGAKALVGTRAKDVKTAAAVSAKAWARFTADAKEET